MTAEGPATKEKLDELTTKANLQYSLKNYNAAADLYSQATALQAELNGEMAPENAELLYRYGRCLYHVAVSKSDVLGAKVAGEGERPQKKQKKSAGASNGEGSSKAAAAAAEDDREAVESEDKKIAEEMAEKVVENKEGMKKEAGEETVESKPYFQIIGDENWDTDSDEEEDGEDEDGEEAAEDDDDDFANAFEILDVARVLTTRQLEALAPPTNEPADGESADTKGKGKETAPAPPSQPATSSTDPTIRALQERLADTHDLQAEISLENERFQDAIPDFRAALALKQQLHPPASALRAEAHYKLSLALEFASVTAIREAQQHAENGGGGGGGSAGAPQAEPPKVDEALRAEAVTHMEAAIASCRLRIAKEEAELAAMRDADPAAAAKKEADVKDVREMIEEMEQRVTDLKAPPVALPSLADTTSVAGALADGSAALDGGFLGSILGESPAQQQARLAAAKSQANDLTGLVRHRKKDGKDGEGKEKENGSGKRKAEEELGRIDEEGSWEKKVKL